ncbi:hypothetical protein [Acinetobacter sp. BSP-28]
MAKKFSELRTKMSKEAQDKSRTLAQKMLNELVKSKAGNSRK